jgi:hypothetical protein
MRFGCESRAAYRKEIDLYWRIVRVLLSAALRDAACRIVIEDVLYNS